MFGLNAVLVFAFVFAYCAPALATNNAYGLAPYERLEDTELYTDFSTRRVDPQVRAYEPRFPLYSDYLVKKRYIKFPEGTPITVSSSDRWDYPEGTRIWKEFAVVRAGNVIPVETRFMEKQNSVWYFATYIWNEDLTSAVRWQGRDGSTPVSLMLPSSDDADPERYLVPAFSQCVLCHDQRSLSAVESSREPVLGFTAFQLERSYLEALFADGSLTSLAISWQRHRTFSLTTLERDITGYLHANCGHCHNPRRSDMIPGVGNPTFHLNYDLDTHTSRQQTNLLKQVNRPLASHLPGFPADARLIVPKDVSRSGIYLRMDSDQAPTRMPLLGIMHADQAFVRSKLRPWISGL